MLGWHISLYQQIGKGDRPADRETIGGRRLAVWQTDLGGLDWLTALANAGNVIELHGNGYPMRYTGQSQYFLPAVKNGPPLAKAVWGAGAGDIVTSEWDGKTVLDHVAMDACRPDEWLLIVAWDES